VKSRTLLFSIIMLLALNGCAGSKNDAFHQKKNDSQSVSNAVQNAKTLEDEILISKFSDISTLLNATDFSGNVIIAHGEKAVFKDFFGYYNRAKSLKYNEQTVFDIGSLTKQFVATAIMKLVEEGVVSESDRLSRFFDSVPNDKQEITVFHLLTHSSGFATNFEDKSVYGLMPHKELHLKAFQTKLAFIPGERYQYSNVGYSLLARIIEKVSDENWENYIRANLLLPTQMYKTGYRLPKYNENNIAINYGADQNLVQRLFNIEAQSKSVGHSLEHELISPGERWYEGAGAFLSTQNDMFHWYVSIRNEALLKKSSWTQIFTPHVAENESSSSHYGFGWVITTKNNERLFTHNGSNGYSFAEFNYFPESDVFVFVSTNDIDNYPDKIMERIYRFAIESVEK